MPPKVYLRVDRTLILPNPEVRRPLLMMESYTNRTPKDLHRVARQNTSLIPEASPEKSMVRMPPLLVWTLTGDARDQAC